MGFVMAKKKKKVIKPRSGTALPAKMRKAGEIKSKKDKRAKDKKNHWSQEEQ